MDDKPIVPSIKLVEMDGVYKVIGLSQTVKYSIGSKLSKEEVQDILNDGNYKVSVK